MPLDLRTISDQVVEDVDDDVVVGDGVDLRPRELHVDQDPLHRRQHQPKNRARGRVQCGGFPWPGFIPSLVAVPPVLPAETETGVRGRGRLIHL